jgi:predicted lysophospholipase L1 biosynthesis ABC-type transport system permease subunit
MLRHLKILEFAISSLLRRRYKNLSILVVYMFTVSVLASVLFLTDSLKEEVTRSLDDVPEIVVQRTLAGRHELIPTDYAAEIGSIPGVGEVKPRYWGYYYDPLTKANYTLIGLGEEPTELTLLQGRLPRASGEVAVGPGVAELLGVEVGDDIVLIDSRTVGLSYELVGTFDGVSRLLTNDLVVLRQQDLVDLFGLPPATATDLAVQVFNQNEIGTVAGKIKQLFPETRPITRSELLRTYDALFSWRSGMMLTIFCSAVIAFCILAWDKATGISGEERREIGVLKAIGWDTSDILELKFWEGLVISLTAFLLGVLGALVHVFAYGAPVLARVMKGWSVLFPDFSLSPQISLYQVFVLAFLTVVPYVASTVIPSWKAAITDPETVMRH